MPASKPTITEYDAPSLDGRVVEMFIPSTAIVQAYHLHLSMLWWLVCLWWAARPKHKPLRKT